VLNKSEPRKLIALGLGVLALRAILQTALDRRGGGSDLTDFALGAVMGIGIGMTLLGIWKVKRSPTCGVAVLIALSLTASGCSVAPHPTTIPTNVGSVFVDDGGRGRGVPIVFVHGNGGNAGQWRAQLDSFRSNGHRALAIDLPGFGRSKPSVAGDYSLAAMAEAIDGAVTGLGLQRFVLVGHSYAGAVVAQYAATHPERVAGVVYVDSAAVVLPLNAEQKEQFTAALRADRMQVVRAMFTPMLKLSSESVRDAVLASVERSSTDAFIGALLSLTTWAPQELVRAYKGPRLAIVASDLETPASFQKQFPDVETVPIGGAGHWLMLDKPDEVTAAIQKFVAAL
jgi:pimeloyl-ACP methyl ester carboxylesterase